MQSSIRNAKESVPALSTPIEESGITLAGEETVHLKKQPVRDFAEGQKQNKNKYGVSLGSVKNVKEQIKEKIAEEKTNHEIIELSKGKLEEVWKEKIKLIIQQRVFLKNEMEQAEIDFTKSQITIKAPTVAYGHLKDMRMDLLDYFKNAFHNDELNVLIFEKIFVDDNKEKLKSNREIFEDMCLENSLLRQLKDKLGLDFEI